MTDQSGASQDRRTDPVGLLTGIFIILLIMAIFFAKEVLLPVVLGVLLSLTLSPVVRALGRLGIPAPLSAPVLILSFGVALAFGIYAMSGPVSGWIADAPGLGETLRRKLSGLSQSVEAVQTASKEVQKIADASAPGDVQRVVVEQPGLLNAAVSNLTSAAASLAVALVLSIFLLASNDLFYKKIVQSFPRLRDKKRALRAVHDIESKVSRYLLTITVINAALGCAVALALHLIGVPNAHVWGVVAALFNYLPFIGALAGVAMVGVYCLAMVDPPVLALLASGTYLALTMLEGQFITPMILGQRLELNTVAVFLTVVFWGWLWGIAGALMAVPILVLVKVICDHVDGLATFGGFLSARDADFEETDA